MNFLGLVKKHSGKILLATTLISYGASLYFTAKGALKVNEIVDKDVEKKVKRKEIIKAVAPSAISTVIGISCIIFSYINNEKKIAAITGALVTAERTLHKYRRNLSQDQDREITRDIYSEKAEHVFDETYEYGPSELEPDEALFCESMTGKTFVMKERDFALAMNEINRNMQLKDAVSFNEWLAFLGLDPIPEGEQYGWSVYSEEFYGYKFIDFWVDNMEFKDGTPYKLITYPFLPHSDYECPDECWSGLEDTYMNSVV